MTAQCLKQNIWRGTCRQCCLLVGIKRSNDQLWALQRLIYPWGSGHWQLKGVLDAQEGGQFEIMPLHQRRLLQRHQHMTQHRHLEISRGEVESRDNYRRSLFVWN